MSVDVHARVSCVAGVVRVVQAEWQRTMTSKQRMMQITRFLPDEVIAEPFESDEQFTMLSQKSGTSPTLLAMQQLNPSQFFSLFDVTMVDSSLLPLCLCDSFSSRAFMPSPSPVPSPAPTPVDMAEFLSGSPSPAPASPSPSPVPTSPVRNPPWLKPRPGGVHVVVFQNGLNVRAGVGPCAGVVCREREVCVA